jgi:hypothetical protein
MKKAQLKELIKQSMTELNSPEYLDLMKKADDTGRGYAERDALRNQAYDLKIGAMTPDEERMVSDYEEEEANKYAVGPKEEPSLEEAGELRRGSVYLNHDEVYAKYAPLFKKYRAGGMSKIDAISQAYEDLAEEYGATFNNISNSIDDYWKEQYMKDDENPLNEVIKKTDMILESWSKKKILKEADLSQANFNDLHQVVKNIAHVNEIGMEEAAMQAIEYIAEQFDVPVDFKNFN